MKKSIFIFTLIIVVASSCNNFLEIRPQAQIPSSAALSSGQNVEATLISAYSELVSDGFLGKNMRLYSELLADNIALDETTLSSTDFTGQVALRNTNILNKDVDNLWASGYRAISKANAVINAVDSKSITDNTVVATQAQWKAEALFIRAVAHFELVRIFGQPYSNAPTTDLGVPIRIKSLTADEKLPRATVDQVYAQVITDLIASATNLPDANGNRTNKWAAKGYLARVYFNKLDYNNAFTTADEIITQGFGITGTPTTPFRNVGNVSPTGGVLFQLVSGGNSFGDFRPATKRWSISQGSGSLYSDLNSSGASDYRFSTMVMADGSRQYSTKWDANIINPPIIRMGEIYLIHAESAVNKSSVDLNTASSSYNIVRGFAVTGFTPVTFADNASALNAIRTERRLELLFEGDRYHELKRLKTASFGLVQSGASVIREAKAYNDASWLLKIPVSETSGNPSIVQN